MTYTARKQLINEMGMIVTAESDRLGTRKQNVINQLMR
jgi:hypothetical protein